jgi:glycosyltransferase involved in cell wall biosynthesis
MTCGAEVEMTVVMPVFNDQESCAQLLAEIAELPDARQWHFCLVDDGSIRSPPRVLDLAQAGLSGVVLRLHRNVGHQSAIACGLTYACATWEGTGVLVIDADGEDRPVDIPELLSRLDTSTCSASVALRRRRSEGAAFRVFYAIYRRLFRVMTGRTIRFGNFMALSAPAARRLSSMHETWLHVAAALLASRIPVQTVSIDRGCRYAGRSTMNFVSLSVHGMRAMMVFADTVFMRILMACVGVIATASLLTAVAGALKFFERASPGWLTTVASSMGIVTIQMASLVAVSLVLAGVMHGDSPREVLNRYKDFIADVEST